MLIFQHKYIYKEVKLEVENNNVNWTSCNVNFRHNLLGKQILKFAEKRFQCVLDFYN